MFGIRYHVATLCAMFLMLGVGFWVGALSNVGQTFAKRETLTIRSLNQKLDSVLQDADRDHTLLRQQEDAIAALTPKLVTGKLAGKRIAIIRTGDYESAMQSAADAIAAAGGTVVSQTSLTGRADLLGDAQRVKIANDLNLQTKGGNVSLDDIIHPLIAALHVGTATRPDLVMDIGVLSDDGVIETSGDYSDPVSAVIVVGGALSASTMPSTPDAGDPDAGRNAMELAVLESLTAGSMTVAGCEPSDAVVSSEPAFSRAGIGSVDCIDLPIGALDLPFVLRGGDKTAYGVKSTATRLVPAALQSDDAQQGSQ